MNKLFVTFILSTLFVVAKFQNLNEIDEDIKNKLSEAGVDLNNLNNTQLPVEEIEKTFRNKCEKQNADPNIIDDLKAQQEVLQTCIQTHVNVTTLQEEVEEAKKTGSMDEVFGKYCKKYPDIYNCFTDVTEVAKKCLTEGEKESLNITMKIVEELKEFACFKDGDRIAMFVAEGGVECLQERQEAIQQCLNSTIGANVKVPKDISSFVIPELVFTNQTCSDFEIIRECVVHELEACKDTTPANIVNALFKFLKRLMPCKKDALNPQTSEVKDNNSASTVVFSGSLIVLLSIVNLRFNL